MINMISLSLSLSLFLSFSFSLFLSLYIIEIIQRVKDPYHKRVNYKR